MPVYRSVGAAKVQRLSRRRFVADSATFAVGGIALPRPARAAPATYAETARSIWAPLNAEGGLREVVRYATLAANSHNSQPWKFRVEERGIRIARDVARRLPVVDPDDHHLFASLGCAAEHDGPIWSCGWDMERSCRGRCVAPSTM